MNSNEDIITLEAQPMEARQSGKVHEFTIEVAVSVSNNASNLKSVPITKIENA